MAIKLIYYLLLFVLLLPSCKVFQVPEYKTFQHLKLGKLGLKESTVSMELVYHNPNKYGYQIKKSEIDLYVDGVYLGKSVSDSLIKVAKKSDFIIPINLKTDMRNLLRNAWNAVAHKTVQIKAKGTVTAGVAGLFKQVNVDYEGRHELNLFD